MSSVLNRTELTWTELTWTELKWSQADMPWGRGRSSR